MAQYGTANPLFDPDPIVDLTHPDQLDHINAKLRAERSKRYNIPASFPFQEPDKQEETLSSIHTDFVASLPVHDSNAFVIGQIKDVRAYLSLDKHNVYTEFSVTVERIIAYATVVPLRSRQIIDATRTGGAVRFPSLMSDLQLEFAKWSEYGLSFQVPQ